VEDGLDVVPVGVEHERAVVAGPPGSYSLEIPKSSIPGAPKAISRCSSLHDPSSPNPSGSSAAR
jgi:hypothetical protein